MLKYVIVIFALSFSLLSAAPTPVFAEQCYDAYVACDIPCANTSDSCLTSCGTNTACADACVATYDSCQTRCAQARATCQAQVSGASSTPTVFDSSASADSAGRVVSLINPLGTTDPRTIIGNLIKAMLSIIGSVTLLMFIYGGVLWITSMGNDKLVAKGKAVLVWTTVGLAVIAGAYTLTNAVITGLTTGQVIP